MAIVEKEGGTTAQATKENGMKKHFTRKVGSKALRAGAALSMALTMCALPVTAQAQQNEEATQLMAAANTDASTTMANDKAMIAYKAKIDKLSKKGDLWTQQADLDGNGVEELICIYNTRESHNHDLLDIYTFKNGKVTPMLKTSLYRFGYAKYSQKGFLSLWRAGHGDEGYGYFKLTKGKYKLIATRARMSKKGGNSTNSKWGYWLGGKETSKTTFDKKIAKIKKGKLHKITRNQMHCETPTTI